MRSLRWKLLLVMGALLMLTWLAWRLIESTRAASASIVAEEAGRANRIPDVIPDVRAADVAPIKPAPFTGDETRASESENSRSSSLKGTILRGPEAQGGQITQWRLQGTFLAGDAHAPYLCTPGQIERPANSAILHSPPFVEQYDIPASPGVYEMLLTAPGILNTHRYFQTTQKSLTITPVVNTAPRVELRGGIATHRLRATICGHACVVSQSTMDCTVIGCPDAAVLSPYLINALETSLGLDFDIHVGNRDSVIRGPRLVSCRITAVDDGTGQPVPSAVVSSKSYLGSPSTFIAASAVTDHAGNCELLVDPLGGSLQIECRGYSAFENVVSELLLHGSRNHDSSYQVRMKKEGSFVGYVQYADGAAVPDVTVLFFPTERYAPLMMGKTNDGGQYSLVDMETERTGANEAGFLVFMIPGIRRPVFESVTMKEFDARARLTCLLERAPRRVCIDVQDGDTGIAIPEAKVRAIPVIAGKEITSLGRITESVDSLGRLSTSLWRQVAWTLEVEAAGYGRAWVSADQAGETDISIRLRKSLATVRIRVVDEAESPVADVIVEAEYAHGEMRLRTTDAHGEVCFETDERSKSLTVFVIDNPLKGHGSPQPAILVADPRPESYIIRVSRVVRVYLDIEIGSESPKVAVVHWDNTEKPSIGRPWSRWFKSVFHTGVISKDNRFTVICAEAIPVVSSASERQDGTWHASVTLARGPAGVIHLPSTVTSVSARLDSPEGVSTCDLNGVLYLTGSAEHDGTVRFPSMCPGNWVITGSSSGQESISRTIRVTRTPTVQVFDLSK